MRRRHLTGDGEAEAGAVGAAGDEGLEKPGAEILGNAGPGIGNADDEGSPLPIGPQADLPTRRRVAEGIVDERRQGPPGQRRIEHRRQRRPLMRKTHACARGKVAMLGDQGGQQTRDIDRLGARRWPLREAEDFADEMIEPGNLDEDRGQRLPCPRGLWRRRGGERVFRLETHRRQWIADFMGDTGRDPPQGRQTFGFGGLAGERLRLSSGLREAVASLVEGGENAVEIALAGGRQRWQIGEVMGTQGGLDGADMPPPAARRARPAAG